VQLGIVLYDKMHKTANKTDIMKLCSPLFQLYNVLHADGENTFTGVTIVAE